MRQTLFMLAIVISSPLAMAQDPVSAATSSAIGADASRQPTSVVAQTRAAPKHKPVSAIGRALAGLLQDTNPQASQPTAHPADTTASDAPRDDAIARPTQLVAKDDPGGGS